MRAVRFACIVRADDARVLRLSAGSDLATETRDRLDVAKTMWKNELDRDVALHQAMAGAKDGAHSAVADLLQKNIVTDSQRYRTCLEKLLRLKGVEPARAQPTLDRIVGVGLRRQIAQFRKPYWPIA